MQAKTQDSTGHQRKDQNADDQEPELLEPSITVA
jgi:hypothetical protein